MRKFLLLVLVSWVAVSSNAQRVQTSTNTENYRESGLTVQFDFYVQDAWGVGLMLRKEINQYFGWNIIGGSFMSGWGQWETPNNVGVVNARLMGIRANAPIYKKLGVFAEITPGYTYMYATLPVYSMSYSGMRSSEAHCFGFDCSAGFVLNKHLALGYNFSFFANKNGNGHIHWGRVSIIF